MIVLQVGLFIVLMIGGSWLINWMLRKQFNIEKEKNVWFSYNHINSLHKKVDWGLRIVTMLVILVMLYLIMYKEYDFGFYILAWVAFMVIDALVKAFFQWKYSDEPKRWILTVVDMTYLVVVLLVAAFYLDFVNFKLL